MDLTTEDYIYIESISILLSYYELPKEKQPKYANIVVQALDVATSRESMTLNLLKELIAQDSVAFQIRNNTPIQPGNNLYNVINTLYTHAGDTDVDIIINTDKRLIKLMSTTIKSVLSALDETTK